MQVYFDFISEHLDEVSATLSELSSACRHDPELRAELDADPRAFFAAHGAELPAETDYRVVENTPEVFHLVMPHDPNAAVSEQALAGVVGGTSQGHNYGCASSAGTIPSTISSASTASSQTIRWEWSS